MTSADHDSLALLFETEVLPLIIRTASYFSKSWGLPVDDLIQEASHHAWSRLLEYDPSIHVAVSTYLAPRIKGAMKDYARCKRHMLGSEQYHPWPQCHSFEELLATYNSTYHSKDSSEFPVFDPVDHRQQRDLERGLDNFEDLIKSLTEQDRQMLRYFFIHGLTLREIGSKLRLCESTICKRLGKAIRLLRQYHLVDSGLMDRDSVERMPVIGRACDYLRTQPRVRNGKYKEAS